MNSSFFLQLPTLARQSRTRTRPSIKCKNLHIIPELSEDDASSSSRASTPSHSTKSERRHATVNVSDITLTRDATLSDDTFLIAPPRPAPRPPVSPIPISFSDYSPTSSPDSFRLTFDELGPSFTFPHPPLPTPSSLSRRSLSSPTSSSSSSDSNSSCTSSPGAGLLTPTTSDDEMPLPARLLPRRASIKPLFITKHPTHDSPCPDDADADDAEWYSREFRDILTLCSPLPPSFPARPDSVHSPASAAPRSRISKPLPDIPPSPSHAFPSAQLDPAFPPRRPSIPRYPPPPVPALPSAPPTPLSAAPSFRTGPRPPPRMSVPADVDPFLDDDDADAESNGSMYSQDTDEPDPAPAPDCADCASADALYCAPRRAPAVAAPERALRSRWSSSTLSSVREAPSASARLRLYFGGRKTRACAPAPSPLASPSLFPAPASPGAWRESAVLVIGAERAARRSRSRSSTSTSGGSECGSADSAGSGLARKPIPVEMFLRSV